MAASIIAIIISIISLGLSAGVLVRERKANRMLDGIIEDLKKDMEEPSPVDADTTLGEGIVTYDRKRNTVVVKGNIKAEGFISAGNKEV